MPHSSTYSGRARGECLLNTDGEHAREEKGREKDRRVRVKEGEREKGRRGDKEK